MTIVDIQINPARRTWPEIRDAALAAEDAGFGAFWVYDHLAGDPLGGSTMYECFALLGAVAVATSRISLGTMVANVWNRQVGTLVTAAASVALIADRPVLLGLGAGTTPTSRWATEQIAVDARIEPSLAARHARVEAALDLAARQWSPDRDERFATFPLPAPPPHRIVGVGSVALSRLAGRRADGVAVPWHHPRRDEFLAATDEAAGGRELVRVAYSVHDDALLDPEHPERVAMAARRIDRLVLAEPGSPPPP